MPIEVKVFIKNTGGSYITDAKCVVVVRKAGEIENVSEIYTANLPAGGTNVEYVTTGWKREEWSAD